MTGDECEKGIHRSLLTAIASAAAVGEGNAADDVLIVNQGHLS